jgi:hypothetical protein
VGEGEIWMRRNRAALLWGFAFCLASAADMQAEDVITIAYPYLGITHITRVGSPPDFPRNVKIHVVEDRPDAPVISGMPAAGCKLWPPNRKLVQVAVVTADDALSGLAADSLTVTGESNEPMKSGNPTIVLEPSGAGGFVIELQADRLGNGAGRIYTLTATSTDLVGNVATTTATCTVPHDRKN